MNRFWKNKTIQTFLLRFGMIFILVQILITTNLFFSVQKWITKSVAELLGFSFTGVLIVVGTGLFEITPSCVGFTSIGMFLGLLFGFRKFSWEE
jgi:hypothetical protein